MALVRGKDGVITLQATDASGATTGVAGAVGKVVSFEFEETSGITEGKFMGSANYAERASTFLGWTASVSALFDPADTGGQGLAVIGTTVEVVLMPGGTASGQPTRTGKAIVNSVKESQEVEGYAMLELGLSGTGALVRSTVPT